MTTRLPQQSRRVCMHSNVFGRGQPRHHKDEEKDDAQLGKQPGGEATSRVDKITSLRGGPGRPEYASGVVGVPGDGRGGGGMMGGLGYVGATSTQQNGGAGAGGGQQGQQGGGGVGGGQFAQGGAIMNGRMSTLQALGGPPQGGAPPGTAAGGGPLTFDLNEFPALAPGGGGGGGGGGMASMQQRMGQMSLQEEALPYGGGQQPMYSHLVGAGAGGGGAGAGAGGGGVMGAGLGGSGAGGTGGEFAIQQEDFPALPGAGPAPSRGGGGGQPQQQQQQQPQQQQQQQTLAGMTSSSSAPPPHIEGVKASSALQQQQQQQQQQQAGGGERYGLLGLLSVIRMTDPDLNTLALGSDLTTLGLNLNASESLYSTFASPWAEAPTSRDPKFFLPQCYNIQKQSLKLAHFGKFAQETLFYIFYAMPKDALQAYAAEELYRREWRFHKEMKLWIKQEGGQYWYFDINHWEKRVFPQTTPANISAIATGLLTEEDVRMHFPAGGGATPPITAASIVQGGAGAATSPNLTGLPPPAMMGGGLGGGGGGGGGGGATIK